MPFDNTPNHLLDMTAEERALATEYLTWLDRHWSVGPENWFQGGGWYGSGAEPHCMITPADRYFDGLCGKTLEATRKAMGIPYLASWNNAETTTFEMVTARVRDALAALKALETPDAL